MHVSLRTVCRQTLAIQHAPEDIHWGWYNGPGAIFKSIFMFCMICSYLSACRCVSVHALQGGHGDTLLSACRWSGTWGSRQTPSSTSVNWVNSVDVYEIYGLKPPNVPLFLCSLSFCNKSLETLNSRSLWLDSLDTNCESDTPSPAFPNTERTKLLATTNRTLQNQSIHQYGLNSAGAGVICWDT